MRKLISGSVLAAFVVVSLLAGLAWAQDEDQGPQPSCLIEELRHDMGEVFEQDKYTHEFIVKNIGNADLEIVSVRPG
jgi:hypothetical protein